LYRLTGIAIAIVLGALLVAAVVVAAFV